MSVFGSPPIEFLTDLKRKRCLVIGASGGVGSLLVQILNENGAGVIDGIAGSISALEPLPLRKAISYKVDDYKSELKQNDYDFVFDCADGKA